MSTEQPSPTFFRNFAMRKPRPALLRVVRPDGEVTDIAIAEVPDFARLGETIDALTPTRLEAFDENENLLRAWKHPGVGKAGTVVPEALVSDAETARLTHFANLLHRAYEHSTDVAFDRLVDMFERQMDQNARSLSRLEALENAYFQALQANAMLAAGGGDESAAPDLGGGDTEALVSAFLRGFAMRQQKKPPKPAAAPPTEESETVVE